MYICLVFYLIGKLYYHGISQINKRFNSEDLILYDANEPSNNISAIKSPLLFSRDQLFDHVTIDTNGAKRDVLKADLPYGLKRTNPSEIKFDKENENVVEEVETFRFIISKKDLMRAKESNSTLRSKQIYNSNNEIDKNTPTILLDNAFLSALDNEDLNIDDNSYSFSMDFDEFKDKISFEDEGLNEANRKMKNMLNKPKESKIPFFENQKTENENGETENENWHEEEDDNIMRKKWLESMKNEEWDHNKKGAIKTVIHSLRSTSKKEISENLRGSAVILFSVTVVLLIIEKLINQLHNIANFVSEKFISSWIKKIWRRLNPPVVFITFLVVYWVKTCFLPWWSERNDRKLIKGIGYL